MFPVSQLCLATKLKMVLFLLVHLDFCFPPNGLYVFINFRNIDATVFYTFVKLFYVYLMAR